MKICMIGLGSIGKKHIKNIVTVLRERGESYTIDAMRSSLSELAQDVKELVSKQYYNIDELPNDYDIIFVTNPTSEHYNTIKKAIEKTKHMFIEKPIFSSIMEGDLQHMFKEGSQYYVACPLRHKAIMKEVKQIIRDKRVYAVRAICSSYLPEWRQNVDYSKMYSAKKEMGGGVILDLIHEWDYLIDLFGNPEKVFRIDGKYSELDINSEDIAIYIAKTNHSVIEVHLDYFGRETRRELELYCSDALIIIDFIHNCIYYKGVKEDRRDIEANDFYLDEMRYFYRIILDGEENCNTIARAYKTLEVALT